MSKAIIPIGPVGSGALMKIINNFVCGAQVAALAEGLAVIERSGLDVEAAGKVLCTGAPGSPLVNALFPRMTERNYDPHFHLALMVKDLEYSVVEGKRHGIDLNVVAAALGHFKNANSRGHGMDDLSSVVEALRS